MRHLFCLCAAAALLCGCNQSNRAKPTRYAYPDATLEVSIRLRPPPRDTSGLTLAPDRPLLLLDIAQKQVVVEARIVEASRASIRNIGLWNGSEFLQPLSLSDTGAESPRLGLGFGFGSSSGRGGKKSGHPAGCTCSACRGGGGGGGGTFTTVGVGVGIPIDLGERRIESAQAVLNEPKLVNVNNQPGRLHVGVVLQVQPKVNESPYIQLVMIPVKMDGPVAKPPGKLITETIIRDGHTVILGGLTSKEDATPEKVPLLGDIPMLGQLFKSDSAAKRKTELVIFVTPHIVPATE